MPRLPVNMVETELRDGTPVLVRPIRPDDKQLLREGFGRLSAESRFRRFLAPVDELSDQQLAYLTEVDYVDHFAWLAVLRDRPEMGIGVARFIRLKEEPEVAEPAITVLDGHQRQGLGTLLLGLLAATARAVGVTTFRAYVLEDNPPMQELLEALGARARHDSPGVAVVDIPLDPEMLPDSPAVRVLKAIAAKVLPAAPSRHLEIDRL